MKNSVLTFAAAALCWISAGAETHEVSLADYGVKPGSKKAVRLNDAVARACRDIPVSDTVKINLLPGVYNLYSDRSPARTYYISNHDQDNPKRVGLEIEGCSNLIIDGNGAELMCHGRMIPLAIRGSHNVEIRNLDIDFADSQIAEVEIVENDTVNQMITYRPAAWVDYQVTPKGEFVHRGYDWSMKPCAGMAFEPESHHIVYHTSDIAVGVDNVTDLGNGLVKAPWKNPKLVAGTIVAMRTYARPCPGIFVDDCRDVRFHGVKLHYAEGMGLIAQNTHDIELLNFGVTARGRYFTTQADATHFSGCSGRIVSKDGIYEGMMDDAINVHGTYLKVVDVVDEQTVVGQYMHHQTYGIRWAEEMDSVVFIRSATMEYLPDTLRVAMIKPYDSEQVAGAKQFLIRFDRAIPQEVDIKSETIGIENITATPSVLFAGNLVRNNRARGALFSTPRKVVVDGNVFDHTSGCAVLLCGDCNGWFETGACRDVTIVNNKFINALTCLYQFTNAVISIYPEVPQLGRQQQYFHSNITITDNEFVTFDTPILYARSVQGLTFLRNIIKHNTDYPKLHWNQTPIWLERVNDAHIQ